MLLQALDPAGETEVESREGLCRLRDLLIARRDDVLEQLGNASNWR